MLDVYGGPTSQDAIAAVVSAEGNLDLAAERLFGAANPDPHASAAGQPKARLTALLAEDPQANAELQRVLRTLTLLQAFSTFKLTAVAVEGSLDRLAPEARIKLYSQLLGSIHLLTDPHSASSTQTINANSTSLNVSLSEAVIRSLPPDIRDALKTLTTPGADVVPLPTTNSSDARFSDGLGPNELGGPGDQGVWEEVPDTAYRGTWSVSDGPPNAARGT